MTYIRNKSLSTGTFPTQLKFWVVKPLRKEVTKLKYLISDLSLYLHHFLKSSKRLYTQDFINTYNIIIHNSILAYEQYGLNVIHRQKKPLISYKMMYYQPYIINCLLVAYFVTWKLPLTVWIMIYYVLSKLEVCGITSKANFVTKSHLNDRYQRGLIDNRYSNITFSGWGLIKQGIPQG